MAISEAPIIDYVYTDTPITYANPAEVGGPLIEKRSFMTLPATLTDGDQVIAMSVPSNFCISEFLYLSDGGTSAGTLDIGIYTGTKTAGTWTLTEANTGSQDFIGTAIAIASAVAVPTDIYQDGDSTIDDRFQPLWQAIGLSADPQTTYFIVLEVETADLDGATKIGLIVRGVQ